MKKLIPYVNVATVKKGTSEIENIEIRVTAKLPADSEPVLTGGGIIKNQSQLYRAVTFSYAGTSEKYKIFAKKIVVTPNEIGLMERGVRVSLESSDAAILKAPQADSLSIDYGYNEI